MLFAEILIFQFGINIKRLHRWKWEVILGPIDMRVFHG